MQTFKLWDQLLIESPVNTKHPLFGVGMRRVKWWKRGLTAKQYGTRVILWTVVILLTAFMITLGVRYAAHINYMYDQMRQSQLNLSSTPSYRSYSLRMYNILSTMYSVMGIATVISIGMSYLLDFLIVVLTVNTINGERNANRWDLLHLTPITAESIVRTMYSTNQLRRWHFTALTIGTRIAIILLYGLILFIVSPVLEDWNIYTGFYETLTDSPLAFIAASVSMIGGGFIFIVEPLWRLRSTTALAMMISAQVKRSTTAITVGAMSLIGIWLFTAGFIVFTGAASMWMLDDICCDWNYYIAAYFLVGGEIAFYYGFFHLMRNIALRRTLRLIKTNPEQWTSTVYKRRYPRWNILRWWLPHSAVLRDNRIFSLNTRGQNRYVSRLSPRLQAIYVFLSMVALSTTVFVGYAAVTVLVMWGLGVEAIHEMMRTYSAFYLIGYLIPMLLIPFVDFFALWSVVTATFNVRVPLHDPLLRLSFVENETLFQAFRGLARLKAWRTVLWAAACGTALVILVTSMYAWDEWVFANDIRYRDDTWIGTTLIIVLGWVAVVFRSRMAAALGMIVAIRYQHYLTVLLTVSGISVVTFAVGFWSSWHVGKNGLDYGYVDGILGFYLWMIIPAFWIERLALYLGKRRLRRERP